LEANVGEVVDFCRVQARTEGYEDMYIALQYVREQRGLRAGPRLLALTLADSYNEGYRYAWPTQAQLADEIGVSKRTIRSWTKELENAGIIEVRRADGRLNHVYEMPEVEERIDERNRERAREAAARRNGVSGIAEGGFR
jgi:DNA-binding transcriptional ArsR family regulator